MEVDLTDETQLGLVRCVSGTFEPCGGSGGRVERIGESVVLFVGGERRRYEVEIIVDGPPEDWALRIYRIGNTYPDDGEPVLWCDNLYTAFEVPVTGALHVNTTDTSDLTAFHGRLEGTTGTGAQFVLEF